MIHFVLLSGGSGTRLWPLSNDTRSKQFLKVLRDEEEKPISMVQRVFSQLSHLKIDCDVAVAACSGQQSSIQSQIDGDFSLVLEPERRDTAPAIMLACSFLGSKGDRANRNDTVIVLPIDTFAEQSFYDQLIGLDRAVQAEVADLVLLGVEPTYPSEKYGYILPAELNEPVMQVGSFKEKPCVSEARELIERGALWNCGVFAFKLGYVLDILRELLGTTDFPLVSTRYRELPKMSFDYEVVESASSVAVSPYAGTWKDLGTWNTLTEEMGEQCAGRVVLDEGSCRDTHVVNETGLPLVVSGIERSVVVATYDGILVCSKENSVQVKSLVSQAAAPRPMYEKRQWGEYRVLDSSVYPNGRKALTKELLVEKDRQFSYQCHQSRSEVWTVTAGMGRVVLDGVESAVCEGSVVEIKPGLKHTVRALTEMRIIEVQLGDLLIEEDIERFGYYWSESDRPSEEEKS